MFCVGNIGLFAAAQAETSESRDARTSPASLMRSSETWWH